MRKALVVAVLVLLCVGATGCGQSIKTYIKDRGYDFMDMTGIKICAGKGFRFGAEIGHGVISPTYELFGPDRLHELLARSDAVVVAAPETPETRHLIDAAALAAMRPGCVLVNVARGSLVDEAALVAALTTGHVAAAALDVFEQEPLPPESPLWDLPNVIITPNIGGRSDIYVKQTLTIVEPNLRAFAEGRLKDLRNLVAR